MYTVEKGSKRRQFCLNCIINASLCDVMDYLELVSLEFLHLLVSVTAEKTQFQLNSLGKLILLSAL